MCVCVHTASKFCIFINTLNSPSRFFLQRLCVCFLIQKKQIKNYKEPHGRSVSHFLLLLLAVFFYCSSLFCALLLSTSLLSSIFLLFSPPLPSLSLSLLLFDHCLSLVFILLFSFLRKNGIQDLWRKCKLTFLQMKQ